MTYPPPPWQTYGDAAAALYTVPASSLDLPAGFRAVSLLGRCVGVLGYVEYKPPSPLAYSELIWMPTMVRYNRARGYWVAKMYVDDERSLRAGREVWGLPKTMAQFSRDGDRVSMCADDGTNLTLELSAAGPRAPLGQSVSTIQQHPSRGPLRFRCSWRGGVQYGRVVVVSFESDDRGWRSFQRATRIPASSGRLHQFEATMHPPTQVS